MFDYLTLALSARQHISEALPYDKSDLRVVAALDSMPLYELIIVFINWRMRFVTPRPRELRKSDLWTSKICLENQFIDVAELTLEIERGVDLTARLSRRVGQGFTVDKKTSKSFATGRRPDLDMLLNDWGIHHLHLGRRNTAGEVVRSDKLAFVVFRQDIAYLIDLGGHGNWASKHLAETVIEHWPRDGIFAELKGIYSGQEFSDDERQGLRNVGMGTPITVSDKVFVPVTGLSTAGTSRIACEEAKGILNCINFFDRNPGNLSKICEQIVARCVLLSERPQFAFRFFVDGYGIEEVQTRTSVGLGKWRFIS